MSGGTYSLKTFPNHKFFDFFPWQFILRVIAKSLLGGSRRWNIWAIHTTLYRVCCIECTWLFVNAQFYAVLCISHSKCIFFLHLNNLLAENQLYFWKISENIYTFFSITQFDNTKPIQLLKTYEKSVYKLYRIFTWKLSTTRICCCIIFNTTIQRFGWINQYFHIFVCRSSDLTHSY